MTGKLKDRKVVACIISMFLCEHSNGRGSITMSERDYKEAAQPCQ
jgi:hypothetical protein